MSAITEDLDPDDSEAEVEEEDDGQPSDIQEQQDFAQDDGPWAERDSDAGEGPFGG